MHRSGTSLVANFINAVGVDLGQNLAPADQYNAAGYWESLAIRGIHEQILKELNCNWHSPPLSFPANWWRKAGIQKLKCDLIEIVRSECDRKDKIWGFKEPRTSILLPLWREIFDELQLEPLYVLAVRDPKSVAASLDVRDHLADSHSEVLWLRTNLDILLHAGNNLRAIVDYDRWFDHGLEQARRLVDSLNLSQSVDETQLAKAFDQVVRQGLRHHSCEESAKCSPIVDRLYFLLSRAAADGKIPDEISEITTTFNKSMPLLNIWDKLVKDCNGKIREMNEKFINYRTRSRKQRKLLVTALIITFVLLICSIVMGVHNWPK
jgi:hypothetical protein